MIANSTLKFAVALAVLKFIAPPGVESQSHLVLMDPFGLRLLSTVNPRSHSLHLPLSDLSSLGTIAVSSLLSKYWAGAVVLSRMTSNIIIILISN